jgi:hypothetical protein
MSTTNPTCTDQGANSGIIGERPETKCLSRGMAFYKSLVCIIHRAYLRVGWSEILEIFVNICDFVCLAKKNLRQWRN